MGDFARRRAKASPTALAGLALAGGGTKRCFGHFSVSASNREELSVRVLWREPLQIVGKARRREAVLGGGIDAHLKREHVEDGGPEIGDLLQSAVPG